MMADFETFLPLIMFAVLGVALFSGFPVALVLGAVGVVFAGVGISFDLMSVLELSNIPRRVYDNVGENLIYPTVPMLIFMGLIIERSGIARDLLICLQAVLRRVPGNLAVAVAFLGLILAPTAGLIGASVATIALIALPTMLDRGYKADFAAGTIAASGTLGIIFPPAIMLFFLADLLEVRMGAMFLAPIVPVLLILGLIVIYCIVRGTHQPAAKIDMELVPKGWLFWAYIGRSIALPVALISMVLGSIIGGIATPTQSGAVGAAGGIALAALVRRITWKLLAEVLERTVELTAMVFFVVIGASIFSYTFRSLSGDDLILELMTKTGLDAWGMLILILGVIFLLGFVIDWIEIALITLPVFYPILKGLDFGPLFETQEHASVWIATMIAIVLQSSFMTPPFGFALFFLKGVAPPSVTLIDIYKGIVPFVLIQLSALVVILAYPQVVLWLPSGVLG